MNTYTKACHHCGQPFTATERARRRFCSAACRSADWRARRKGRTPGGGTTSARALSLAWDLGCGDRTDQALVALEQLSEAEARAVLAEALELVGDAIDTGALHDQLAAAGLLAVTS